MKQFSLFDVPDFNHGAPLIPPSLVESYEDYGRKYGTFDEFVQEFTAQIVRWEREKGKDYFETIVPENYSGTNEYLKFKLNR